MQSRKVIIPGVFCLLAFAPPGMAQDELTCADIEWKSVVTDRVPSIADACDAVLRKNGELFARVEVELVRVRGRTLTYRIINNDGSSGGTYTQQVEPSWRAHIAGRSYRASDLSRGQQLNVYLPGDRWEVIPETMEQEPAPQMAAVPEEAPELPKTASPLPLIGLLGSGFMALGAGLGWLRRRRS